MAPATMVTVAAFIVTLEMLEAVTGAPMTARRVVGTAAEGAGMVEVRGDQAVEHFAVQGWLDEDRVTLNVAIYRVPSIDSRWQLELVNHKSGSTCWSEQFRTDRDALEAFDDFLETEGVGQCLASATQH